jgi:hypothetical protein
MQRVPYLGNKLLYTNQKVIHCGGFLDYIDSTISVRKLFANDITYIGRRTSSTVGCNTSVSSLVLLLAV